MSHSLPDKVKQTRIDHRLGNEKSNNKESKAALVVSKQ